MKAVFIVIITFLFGFFIHTNTVYASVDSNENNNASETTVDYLRQQILMFNHRDTFGNYLLTHEDNYARPNAEHIINAADFTLAQGMDIRFYENHEDMDGVSVWTDENGFIEWEVYIETPGLYNLAIMYYSVLGKNADIQRAVFINGSLPFTEAGRIEFRRTWVAELDYIRRDNQGNDIRPTMVEQHMWRESVFEDSMGSYAEPFLFYLEAGFNTITLLSQREPMIIRYIRVFQVPSIPSWEEFTQSPQAQMPTPAGVSLTVQAENVTRVSSPMLFPMSDRSSPAVTPFSAREIRINTIGHTNWSNAGQWIEWDIEVPESGLYKIAMNLRQNFVRGTNVYRRVTINGEIPFREAEAIPFAFRNTWRVETLGGQDEPWLFYLNKGTNTLRMEVVLGDYGEHVLEVADSVFILNELYRQLIMIMGPNPDIFRDYQITRNLPHMVDDLLAESARLLQIFEDLDNLSGGHGQRDAVIRNTAQMLERMALNIEDNAPRMLGTFAINIGSLGTWLMLVRDMPLAIDSIYILSTDATTPRTNNGLWARFVHSLLRLIFSFIIDYTAIGNVSEDDDGSTIVVWLGTGRDQANTLRALIDESFTPQTGIQVDLKLMDMGGLLPATLSRQGPDVSLMVGGMLPMNFGIRGAVMDLTRFDDLDEVIDRFLPSSMVPFEFDGHVFGLPETQTFNMLFYRRDVLADLNLEIPQTWDEMRSALAVLSMNNMSFGIPTVVPSPMGPMPIIEGPFGMFLFQAGGDFYNDDGSATLLDSDLAVSVFGEFTRFFTDYRIPYQFDFANRFRTGEMPLAIVDYTSYNMLQVFAPEIRGLWGFTTVPGTLREDGTLDRSVATGGSAAIIMEQTTNPDASWEFIKWWTSADTQLRFGFGMEALMGAAARWPTANQEAFSMMPWPVVDYEQLREQFQYARGIPQVPGGYYMSRQLNNAFFTVVVEERVGSREALTDFTRYMNAEISRRRREFGLE